MKRVGKTFFHFGHSESIRKLADWDESVETEKVRCPHNSNHQHGGKRLTELSVVLPDQEVDDVVWIWGSECLVGERALMIFRDYRFTGVDFKPVKARYKRGKKKPPRLWELVTTGWGGIISSKTKVRCLEKCPYCGYSRYSRLRPGTEPIDESHWDGSDFFMVWPMPLFRFITARVAQATRDHKISGVRLIAPSTISADGFAPGGLREWLPKARARELGKPLGIY